MRHPHSLTTGFAVCLADARENSLLHRQLKDEKERHARVRFGAAGMRDPQDSEEHELASMHIAIQQRDSTISTLKAELEELLLAFGHVDKIGMAEKTLLEHIETFEPEVIDASTKRSRRVLAVADRSNIAQGGVRSKRLPASPLIGDAESLSLQRAALGDPKQSNNISQVVNGRKSPTTTAVLQNVDDFRKSRVCNARRSSSVTKSQIETSPTSGARKASILHQGSLCGDSPGLDHEAEQAQAAQYG